MKRILVAGATGYSGGHVVTELKRRGYWVRALARPGRSVDGADEVLHARATVAEELKGVCDGIDGVFSSLGITRQTDKVTYMDVDYGANSVVLAEAQEAGVKRFVFVSAARPELFTGNAILEAREKFVGELQAAPISACVVRGTGFFNDMTEFFKMAQKGRMYLFGNGENRMNPIHGADLAAVCVDQLEGDTTEVVVGGPDVLTYNQITELAFAMLEKPPRIIHFPVGPMRAVLAVIKPFNKRLHTMLEFMTTASSSEIIGEQVGTHHLEDHFRSLLQQDPGVRS